MAKIEIEQIKSSQETEDEIFEAWAKQRAQEENENQADRFDCGWR
jgi:hypothetical protein